MEYIIVEPEWENVALFSAECLRNHDYEIGANTPIISFIEQIRYLTVKEPEAVERILEYFRKQG